MNDSHLSCSVHSGTHIDDPLHFLENSKSVDQLPLGLFVGPVQMKLMGTDGAPARVVLIRESL